MTDAPVITSLRMTTSKPRRPPKAGDRRITKAHGLQIRVMARDSDGRMIVNRGRQVFEWRCPQYLNKWDHHHLTFAEKAHFFPPERELGYMQQRGAA